MVKRSYFFETEEVPVTDGTNETVLVEHLSVACADHKMVGQQKLTTTVATQSKQPEDREQTFITISDT